MNLIKRVISMAICTVILFLSPVSVYFSASNISTVHASGEIVVEGASIAWEWLLAWMASVGLTAAAVENRDALMASYKEYLDAQIDTELTIGEAVSDKCIEIYDSASNAVSSIPWDDYYNSLGNFHDTAVDNLTGIYMKVCPELLESFESFIDSIISGDTYIEGISNVIEERAFTSADYEAQWAGDYNLKAGISSSDVYTNPYTGKAMPRSFRYSFDMIASVPRAVVFYKDPITTSDGTVTGYSCAYQFFEKNARYGSDFCKLNGTAESVIDGVYGSSTVSVKTVNLQYYLSTEYGNITNFNTAINANIPVFGSLEDAKAYLNGTLDYTNALNFARSMYDTITDNNDLPLWDIEALWQRVSRAVDVIDSIGAYGDGVAVGTKDWANDLPWVDVGALSEWDDVIDRTLEGILSGAIELPLDIPDNPTYVDVWQDVIDKTWDDVITVDPTKADDPAIPIDPDKPIEDNPALGTSIEDTITQTQPFFSGLSGELKNKFPFSIPWDLIAVFTLFQAEPETPRIEVPFVIDSLGIRESIVIDLSGYGLLSRISRSLMVVLFVLGLIKMTPTMLSFGKDL